MDGMIPSSFSEALSGVAFAFAILLTFLSFISSLRTTAIRLAAVLYLATFALFANHVTTYFAAIFIVATAVTEIEFLHILAAIIRGDKNYFEFRREFLTRDESMMRADATSVSVASPETPSEGLPAGSPIQIPQDLAKVPSQVRKQLAFQIEDAALGWLEPRIGRPLQRYVRLSSERGSIELDGIAQRTERDKDIVVEVSWIPSGTLQLLDVFPRAIELSSRYQKITKRDCEVIFLFVAPTKGAISDRASDEFNDIIKESFIDSRWMVVTYDELGIEATPDAT